MKSMTGYGKGEASNGKVTTAVEIKTVNNRFRDIQIRVPKPYLSLEPKIRAALNKKISRGRIEVFVRRESVESAQQIYADPMLAEQYFKAMSVVAKRLQRDTKDISLSSIMEQPGVMKTVESLPDAIQEWSLVSTAMDMAIEDLSSMRLAEGTALRADLERNLIETQRIQAEIEAETEGLNKHLMNKMEQKLLRLLGDRVDPIRLAQEAAILVDKSDISEELTRLRSHCDQMAGILNKTGPVGRKIEFLLQEFNREINTIGSKASGHKISIKVVELKSVIERIREQAANIE